LLYGTSMPLNPRVSHRRWHTSKLPGLQDALQWLQFLSVTVVAFRHHGRGSVTTSMSLSDTLYARHGAVGSPDPISAQSNACGQVLQVSPHGHPETLRRMHCLDASNVKLEAVSQACGDERWEGYSSSASPRLAI